MVTAQLQQELLPVAYEGGVVDISTKLRGGGGDLLLCLHGLGCAKESFDAAFDNHQLAGVTICTFDFPGHGASGRLPVDAYSIETYADITVSVIRQLAPDRLFLVCHSMGGAVGLVATQELAGVDRFVNVEGNLVGRDCGLVSRQTAAQPLAEFVDQEFPRFQSQLAGSHRADLRAWAGWYAQADPAAVHALARSLVEWSDSGQLLKLFTSLDGALYLHGSDTELDYLLGSLDGVPVRSISGSGHFPMVDNSPDFWHAIADATGALCP